MAEKQEQESNPQYPTEPPPLPPAVAPPPRPRRPDPARAQGIGSMLLVTGALAAVAGGLVQAWLRGIRVSGQGLANMGNLLLA